MPERSTSRLRPSAGFFRPAAGGLALVVASAGMTGLMWWLFVRPGSAQPTSIVRFRSLQPAIGPLTVSDTPGFQSFTLADVNNDGMLDLITVDEDDGAAHVLLGNGDGTFQQAQTFNTSNVTSPLFVAVADVASPFASNGAGAPDGYPDIIIADDTDVEVLLGDGTGNFGPPEQDFSNVLDVGTIGGIAV